jgi:hypothetical protein
MVWTGAQPLHAGQVPAPSDRLDLDLYWEYEVVSDPQISPDGTQIIDTRQAIDRVNDKRESSLWALRHRSERDDISPEQVMPPAPLRLRPSPRG